MATELEKTSAPDEAPSRRVAPPSAGRALLIIVAAVVASCWFWKLPSEWWLHQTAYFWPENRSNHLLIHISDIVSDQRAQAIVAANLLVFHWVTRPLWRMPSASRDGGQTRVLVVCVIAQLLSVLLWVIDFWLSLQYYNYG